MPTITLDTTKPTATQTILERSVCLLLRCGKLGNHRKVELASVEMQKAGESVAAQKTELGAQKKLFADADLRPCKKIVDAAKAYVQSMSLDGGLRMFGSGAHLLPTLAVGAVDRRLEEFRTDLAAHAELLAQRLPAIIEARRVKLGPFFNLGDYPTAQDVLDEFSIAWSYVRFGAPDHLEEVDAAAYARAVADWDGRLTDAYQDVVVGLRESAALVMRELALRLRPTADGKVPALRPTALRDLQELLERLPVLNSVAGDDALAGIVARVGGYARGLNVEVLRDNPSVRGMLLAQAEEAAGQLEALVTTGRALSFGEAL